MSITTQVCLAIACFFILVFGAAIRGIIIRKAIDRMQRSASLYPIPSEKLREIASINKTDASEETQQK